MATGIDPEIIKAAAKEGIKEFLNEQLSTFEHSFFKWAVGCIAAMALAGLTYLFLASHGWKP